MTANNGTKNTLLPGIEPSENDLVEMAMAAPLARKVAKAVAVMQEYEKLALELSPTGYYLCQSGGKDSAVIEELAKMAGVQFTSNHKLTTVDAPELIYHLRECYPNTIIHKPKIPLLTRLVEKSCGPPIRRIRWCCDEYKERGGGKTARVLGVRYAESKRRRGWAQFAPIKGGGVTVSPILYWTDEDVWQFIGERNIKTCILYKEGFKRLGCVGCPLNPTAQKKEFARWPRYEAAWKRAIFKHWDKWHGVPRQDGEPYAWEKHGSAQGVWNWWISGKAAEGESDCWQMDMEF